jgi:hypothetical protein
VERSAYVVSPEAVDGLAEDVPPAERTTRTERIQAT